MLLINYSFRRTLKLKTCPVTRQQLKHGWIIKTLKPVTVIVKQVINLQNKEKSYKIFPSSEGDGMFPKPKLNLFTLFNELTSLSL